jgi:hypothetical protein
MGIKQILALLLASASVWTTAKASQEVIDKRQSTTGKYCRDGKSLCYSEHSIPSIGVTFRIAVPDVPSAPFDIFVQVIAPVSVTWAGLAWGGAMTNNPLLVAWPYGGSAVASSRWASYVPATV